MRQNRRRLSPITTRTTFLANFAAHLPEERSWKIRIDNTDTSASNATPVTLYWCEDIRDEYEESNADTGAGGDSRDGDHIVDQRHEMHAAVHLKGDAS